MNRIADVLEAKGGDGMNSELLKEIKEKGLFATTCRLQTEARAKLPQNLSGLYTLRQTMGSKLNGPGIDGSATSIARV